MLPQKRRASSSAPMGYLRMCVTPFPTRREAPIDGSNNSGNSRRPELTQINLVDIYLFRGDSRQEVLSFRNQPNPSNQAGFVRAQVDDRWFGEDGLRWSEESGNQSYPFYWVIIRSDSTLDGNEIPQPIFTAVRTCSNLISSAPWC